MIAPSSPRLQVLIDGTTVPSRVLVDLKNVSGRGFAELRGLIASGHPVLEVEMFTNDWFDAGAARMLDLLLGWKAQGIDYILREAFTESDEGEATGDASRITLDELHRIVGSGLEERARIEELDNLRYGDGP